MFARVTQLEIDTLRVDMAAAADLYRAEVMPELHEMDGFLGCLVLTTPEGKGEILTFWATAEQASADLASGFYPATLERYTTLFRAPPGRERYEVTIAELPVTAPGG